MKPGSKVRLKDFDPGYHGQHESENEAEDDLKKNVARLAGLQELLYAERKHGLLIVLQGIDAAGKDGTCWHVMTAMNPQGTTVTGFKQPTEAELAHDFLWRVHPHAPARGQVAVFNRSHYEDVLVVRVHKLVPKAVWSAALRPDQRIRAAPRRERHDDPEVLPADLARGAARALQGPARRSGEAMEDQRYRLQGARALGRLCRRLRGHAAQVLDRGRPLVRDPVEPQVVPQPRGLRRSSPTRSTI